MERQSGQISTAFQHNHAQTNQKSMWQSILFVNKRISDKCFEMNAVIQHTVHGSSWNCSASLKGDLVTQGTTWDEHWSFSPLFCTDSWLMWWAGIPRVWIVFSMFGNGNYYRFMPWWQKAARFPDMVMHLENNRFISSLEDGLKVYNEPGQNQWLSCWLFCNDRFNSVNEKGRLYPSSFLVRVNKNNRNTTLCSKFWVFLKSFSVNHPYLSSF